VQKTTAAVAAEKEETMTHRMFSSVAGIALTALVSFAPSASRADEDTIDAHLRKAKIAAGLDFLGTLSETCVAPYTGATPDAAPPAAPDRSTWFTEPAQVFDNLYFVGTLIHSSWALKTSEGIILIDTLYEYATDEAIVGGLKKLGLDPASIKYVIVSHAHGDHVGGAKMLQDRFHPHLVLSDADWKVVEGSKNGFPNGKPQRDVTATDGQKLTLGDTPVTLIETPGHTPGTLSMIFAVKDRGRPITVAYSGGTGFNFEYDVPHFDTYISSQRKMAKAAADANATIVMSNHSEFDEAASRVRMSRNEGEPSPFEVGNKGVARYFQVTDECAQVAKMKLQQGMPVMPFRR
jgi:metallo-beta-lactamase class B